MIYLDTNTYLDFYNTIQPKLRKVLPTLVELADRIIVPQQIVDEVKRNSVRKLMEYSIEAVSKIAVTSVTLPEQHEKTGETTVDDWNRERRDLEKSGASLLKRANALLDEMLTEVQFGRDSTSQSLHHIFRLAAEPNEVVMERARARRERGNPPGKRGDPLGDQLSWEVLLDACAPGRDLWLVSRDGDYGVRRNTRLYLSAFLQEELTERLAGGQVHAFDNIGTALTHYRRHAPVVPSALPADNELADIAQESQRAHPATMFPVAFSGPIPEYCPRCNAFDSFTGLVSQLQRFGAGRSLQVICTRCGLIVDTGEPTD